MHATTKLAVRLGLHGRNVENRVSLSSGEHFIIDRVERMCPLLPYTEIALSVNEKSTTITIPRLFCAVIPLRQMFDRYIIRFGIF
jgi:hypothetical protein